MLVDTEHEYRDIDTTPQQELASEETEKAVDAVKAEVDTRDARILEELHNIHNAIMQQTEHHVRHLEQHTLSQQAPVQEVATRIADSELPSEPVHLSIGEPHDITTKKKKAETSNTTRKKKFGKRGKS